LGIQDQKRGMQDLLLEDSALFVFLL